MLEWQGQAETELTADEHFPMILVQRYSNMDYPGI